MRGTFGLFTHNLPTFQPGQAIPTRRLNAAVEALERSRPTAGPDSGLSITQLPTGFAFRAAAATGLPKVMIVTTTVTAMSGTTAGVGAAREASFTPATRALVAGSGAELPVFSYHEKTFVSGAIIAAITWAGKLWAVDVDKCGNYV